MDIEKLIERLWNYKELEQVKRIPQKRQKKRQKNRGGTDGTVLPKRKRRLSWITRKAICPF